MLPCSVEGCGVHRRLIRGMCRRHYDRDRLARARRQNPNRNNVASDRSVGERLADLRLAVEMARARLRQAVIVAEYPHVGAAKGVTAAQLIDEALDCLDL